MLSRIKGLSRGGWIAVGISIGAILVPSIALAAFSDVRIVGVGGGTVAQVTQANQLRTAEIDASRIRIHELLVGENSCFATPAFSGGFVFKQAILDLFIADAGGFVAVFPNRACTGQPLFDVRPDGPGETTIPFDPGIGVANGGGLSVKAFNEATSGDLYLSGYSVPSADIPTTTSTILGTSVSSASRAKVRSVFSNRR